MSGTRCDEDEKHDRLRIQTTTQSHQAGKQHRTVRRDTRGQGFTTVQASEGDRAIRTTFTIK